MRRLVIFVFYDFENIVDNYVEYLLESIRYLADKLVIVSNSELNDLSRNKLYKYTNFVYQRDNIGFDGGAYKDTLLRYLNIEEIKQYDELILMNDTFYGPFYPWNDMFFEMEKIENIDFWGITSLKGHVNKSGNVEKERIQSYFLVFSKQIIQEDMFIQFWENMNYPNSYIEAINYLEIGLYEYLCSQGYHGKCYTDMYGVSNREEYGVNPYGNKGYELIKDCKCPILRQKIFKIYITIMQIRLWNTSR